MKLVIASLGFLAVGCTIPEPTTSPAKVKVTSVENVTRTSAELRAELIDEGCMCTSVSRGFIVSEDKNKLISSGLNINVGAGNKGEFVYNIDGLKQRTQYYVAAYAINSTGKTYSDIDSFMTKHVDVDTMIIKPHSSWEYTFDIPSTNWKITHGNWKTGQAPFGNVTLNGDDNATFFNFKTFWPTQKDGYIRTKVNLSDYDLKTIRYFIGVDNGYELYVNGNLVSSKAEFGWAKKWEYIGLIPQSFLKSGDNIIALVIKDDGGWNAFDIQITGKGK